MFKYRAISFPILLALLGYMVWFPEQGGKYVYAVCAVLMVGLAVYELGAMTKKIGFKNFPVVAGILGAVPLAFVVCVKFNLEISPFLLFGGCLLLFLVGWFGLLVMNNRNNKVIDADKGLVEYSPEKTDYFLAIPGTVGLAVILGVPLTFTGTVYYDGAFLFLFLVLITKAMDTGGYIFGKLSAVICGGNHKICPTFSPKKSWEGTIGGLIFSVGAALLFWKYSPVEVRPFWRYSPVVVASVWDYVVYGIVLGLGSFAGDLTESVVKRICGVKDSNHIIPGMGGAFDVLDSFIYNGIIFFLLQIIERI